jgi:hypothetical protein
MVTTSTCVIYNPTGIRDDAHHTLQKLTDDVICSCKRMRITDPSRAAQLAHQARPRAHLTMMFSNSLLRLIMASTSGHAMCSFSSSLNTRIDW